MTDETQESQKFEVGRSGKLSSQSSQAMGRKKQTLKLKGGSFKFINGRPIRISKSVNQPKETKAARKLASKQRKSAK